MDMIWHTRYVTVYDLTGTGIDKGAHLGWHTVDIDEARAKAWLAQGRFLNVIGSAFICEQISAKLEVPLVPHSGAPANVEGNNEVLVILPPGEGEEGYKYQLRTACLRFTDKSDPSWPAKFCVEALNGLYNGVFGNDVEKPNLYCEEDKPVVRAYALGLLQVILNKADEEKPRVGGQQRDPQVLKERATENVASIFRELREKDPMESYRERMEILNRVRR